MAEYILPVLVLLLLAVLFFVVPLTGRGGWLVTTLAVLTIAILPAGVLLWPALLQRWFTLPSRTGYYQGSVYWADVASDHHIIFSGFGVITLSLALLFFGILLHACVMPYTGRVLSNRERTLYAARRLFRLSMLAAAVGLVMVPVYLVVAINSAPYSPTQQIVFEMNLVALPWLLVFYLALIFLLATAGAVRLFTVVRRPLREVVKYQLLLLVPFITFFIIGRLATLCGLALGEGARAHGQTEVAL